MTGSPYIQRPNNSVRITMLKVMAALVPGVLAHAWYFGPGIWISLTLCGVLALLYEGAILRLRGYPLQPFLSDGSALVTAMLFALSVPTLAPWWLYAVGMLFAIVVAKQLYGGLGQNPFNPAMIGYAVLIVSFPSYMTHWPGPVHLVQHAPSLGECLALVFGSQHGLAVDAYTMASPLDMVKTLLKAGVPKDTILASPIFGRFSGEGIEMVAAMYALGGLFLLFARVITWHIPLAFLAGMVLVAGGLQLADPDHHLGPLFHLFTVSAMMGAFFIATDPVSAATTPLGKLIYAGLAGGLAILIRTYGGFPDGVAFSVLIMNMAAPFIDTYTQPRVFGHGGRGGRA